MSVFMPVSCACQWLYFRLEAKHPSALDPTTAAHKSGSGYLHQLIVVLHSHSPMLTCSIAELLHVWTISYISLHAILSCGEHTA